MPYDIPMYYSSQANFIKGGLLLTVAIHRHATDATGLGEILRTWAQNTAAAASGSSTFTSYDAPSNDRSALMHGIPPKNKADFPEYTIKAPKEEVAPEAAPPPPAAFQPPPMDFNIFYFSSAKLAGLKLDAHPGCCDLAYNSFMGPDVVSTSWADVEVYSTRWGGDLGAPAFLRVPGDGADGLVNILPRRPDDDGGLEVIVWLEAGAMGRLVGSQEFLRGSRSFGASF
ncbi:uncharacterized protein PG986_001825 [Apiospora aurea]|uniref:Uncharacterized protein n=1 Tax=Apiospora aurea TaxID=335848 RepID=A0ABR1QYP4_9PEZI